MTKEQISNKVRDFVLDLVKFENLDIEATIQDWDDIRSYRDLYDTLDIEGGFYVEIIYYSNAINFLRDNDPSLKESLEIAAEFGYALDTLSSEVLASLLASEYLRRDFEELEDELTTFFDELEEEEEDCELPTLKILTLNINNLTHETQI